MNQPDIQTANRRAAWKWGSLIVGLLGLQVAGGIFAIILATGDESVAVVPDYHQKALNWDEEMSAKQASDQLGWQCDIAMLPNAQGEGLGGLTATLKDDQGRVIEVDKGTLSWYQHIRANDVLQLPIPSGPLAAMRLDDCFKANGLWDVTIDVTDLDGNRYMRTVTLNITGVVATEAK